MTIPHAIQPFWNEFHATVGGDARARFYRLPPKPGALSVVTNWQGKPLCVIETKAVAIVPYEEVSEEFAATEGEGDGSLRYWREAHWAYFGRECTRIGRVPSMRMPIVCERFEVIYRGAANRAA